MGEGWKEVRPCYLLSQVKLTFCAFKKHKNRLSYYKKFIVLLRHPDHEDPPIQPTKLLLVERVKRLKGNPYWQKTTLKNLKLDSEVTYHTGNE